MNKKRKRAISLFVIMFLMLLTIGTVPVYADLDTVRIGFFISDKYGFFDANGDLTGYDVHLSKTIGMYGGFNAEMAGYDNVSEMEEDLRAGKVDALIDFLHTEKRDREFIFTSNAILEEQVSLYTRNTMDAPTVESITKGGTLRVGHVSDAGFLDYFTEHCADLGISLQMVDFHDEPAMNSAMALGETDACLTGSAVPVGYRILLSTPPLNSYMMFRSSDTALQNRIDTAISQLKTDNPDYISNLYHSYVASNEKEMSPLTIQERNYLKEHPDLSVALVRGAEPFTVEKKDGSLGGIIPDYYRVLGEKLGVSFRFVAYDSTQEAVDAVSGGEADILGHYYGNIILAEKNALYDTMEYGTTECARLIRSGFNGEVKTVAVTNRTASLLTNQLDPDIKLVPYPNVETCYQALMDGKVDTMVGSMTGISWLINQHTLRGVNLSILPNVTLAIRGAVSNENSTLLFVLNKAIVVSSDVLNQAILENAVNGETDLLTTLENLPLGFSIAVIAVLAILVILLIITLIRLSRSSKERVSILNREMNIDGLTGAGSRRYGANLFARELKQFKNSEEGPLFAMFDIDHFKGKNDTYGHEYGDFVLKNIVDVLRRSLRETDELIRWGGDEFILMFPLIQSDDAEQFLEKTVHAVNSADFTMDGKGEQITISVGAAFFASDDRDINDVLRRCDIALYEAKKTRNTYRLFSDEMTGKEL